MDYRLATLVLGPIFYLQGRYVRHSTPRLPEPPGPRQGRSGSGQRLRLLVLGDSAAAGVGASHQDEALLGNLVQILSVTHAVEWVLSASTGATTASALRRLEKLDSGKFHVAVTSLGVNDVISGIGRNEWRERQAKLRDVLRRSFNVGRIVVCGLPPVHAFPALPQPLRWYLGAKARAFDSDLRKDVESESDISFLSLRFAEDTDLMAPDGFHPGPAAYRQWGRKVATLVSSLLADNGRST